MSSFYTLPPSRRDLLSPMQVAGFDDPYGEQQFLGSRPLGGWGSKGGRQPAPRDTAPRSSAQQGSAAGGTSPAQAVAVAGLAALTQAYSRFHAVQMEQIGARQAADFEGSRGRLLELDYRSALQRAEAVLQQGQAELAVRGLQGGQARADTEAALAARGIVGSGGNVQDTLETEALVEGIDRYHINLATVRAARAAREEALSIQAERRYAEVNARNLRRTARYAQPEAAFVGGALGALSSGMSIGGG